ncbi:MAG: imelysin family protein [Ferrovibrio sp.]|uniref:imelysin family protein n=1 Tax=Ferrovibrio sp. TaxID=1917215 RepID=UPI00391A8C70
MRIPGLVFVLLMVFHGPALALDGKTYEAINRAAVEGHVLPRYDALATATGKLEQASKAFCAMPAAERKVETLQQAYHDAADAWQDIQHVRFGPIDLFFRSQRFAFWPDPRNTIGKQMAELIAKHASGSMNADVLGRGSVAVQGLPALERMIFSEDAKKLQTGVDTAFRCGYVIAIAENLAGMARETQQEWRAPTKGFAAQMLKPGQGADARYRDAKEATLELFKSLYTAIELAADHKLARPLGASADDARPRLAESWRSERSLRNVQHNLTAATDLYVTAFAPHIPDKSLDEAIRAAFAQAHASAAALPMPLERAVQDAGTRKAAEKLAADTQALKSLVMQQLPEALQIPVGFNALDGD